MSKRSDKLLLEDIVESIEKILKYTNELTFEEFISNEMVIDAVVRNFEIIGEAANRISEELRKRHSEIPWRQIIGFRHRIVHEYFGIDYEIVWKIVRENLDDLFSRIDLIIAQEKN